MPTIRMKPPIGIALTPYSVSPLVRDQTVLPKPTKYCVTRTPKSFAGTMCPTSCSAIDASTPSRNSTMPRV